MFDFRFSLETTDQVEAIRLRQIFWDMYSDYLCGVLLYRGKDKVWFLQYKPINRRAELPSLF